MAFNPNGCLIKLKGKDYLEVKWRLVWFREEHPDWGIETSIHHYDEKQAIVQARITDAQGAIKAMGTKQECKGDFGDYLEKAETGSVGRALGMLGYGTQFAPEFEEGVRIVDAPVELKRESIGTLLQSNLVDQANAVFPPGTVVDADKDEQQKAKSDQPHPNARKETTAITKTIAITAGNKGVETHDEAKKFFGREIASLYDIGADMAEYKRFLDHLIKLPNKGR